MIRYEQLIYEALLGDTPKEKFENLQAMQSLLRRVGWPRRGTEEDNWDVYDVAEMARLVVSQEDGE